MTMMTMMSSIRYCIYATEQIQMLLAIDDTLAYSALRCKGIRGHLQKH